MLSFVTGPDIFRAKQFIDQIIKETLDQNPQINLRKIDGFDITPNKLSEQLEPLQLFSQQQLLIIKNLFTTKKQTAAQQTFIDYLDKPDPNNIVIIWEQNNLDKRTKNYKKIQKHSKTKDFQLFKTPQLISWLTNYCRQNQINIQPDAIQTLVGKNPNTFAIFNELIKAKIYSDNNITTDTINQLTPQTPQEIIFDLTDQIGHKQSSLAYQTAVNLIQKGEDPQKILATLSTHILNLIIVKQYLLKNSTPNQIITRTNIHQFVINKCVGQSRNFSIDELKTIYHLIAQADYSLKTGQSTFAQEIYRIIYFQHQNTPPNVIGRS
ncbi:DNA polymerase III subunit delta [Patescibacteria group bacterium]|nr:DNA polymerase III subunit delta [Patescibacteria group bacterium]